jgi:hypothetical protein
MDLVRDLLDIRLMDRRQRSIGRVDGVRLELRPGAAPRVAAMEIGVATAAHRVHPRIGRWVRQLARRWSPVPLGPVRLPLTLMRDVGVDVELDVDAESDRRLLRLEKWLRRHVIARIPGGGA